MIFSRRRGEKGERTNENCVILAKEGEKTDEN